MEEKRKADNQFARNFFFVEHVYKETRTMINDPRFSKKKKKNTGVLENFCYRYSSNFQRIGFSMQ